MGIDMLTGTKKYHVDTGDFLTSITNRSTVWQCLIMALRNQANVHCNECLFSLRREHILRRRKKMVTFAAIMTEKTPFIAEKEDLTS
jgi:hypothetical protein